ncbi:hypothetical protein ABGB12_28120 [Actinocorallia sp. B10E7]|uniref:hypothetical protein n=1 Tax=Actinocorallia sp. B10E7 TaxID=3153558 RepID=UPI00325D9EB3
MGKYVYFLDERIETFTLVKGRAGEVLGIELSAPANAHEEIRRKLLRVVSTEIVRQLDVPRRTLWEIPGRPARDVLDELVDSGAAFRSGPGQVAVGGPLLKAMRAFDAVLLGLVAGYGAVEYRYPTLLPMSVIDQCGYLDAFPRFAMFVSRLRADIDVYARFAELTPRGRDLLALTDGAAHCLPPTMCFHTYHQFAGRRLAETAVVTSRGKAFRFESRYEHGLDRLWDFTIRETVFLGDRTAIRDRQAALMEDVRELLGALGLRASCEVANDPFFADADPRVIALQIVAESKREVRMPIGDDRSVAVASFNYADDHFTRRFDITAPEGTHLKSACVGFGLERLAYAFLCQYGLDEQTWPPLIGEFRS